MMADPQVETALLPDQNPRNDRDAPTMKEATHSVVKVADNELLNGDMMGEMPQRRVMYRTPLDYLYHFSKSFPVQCLLIAVVIVDLSFLLYEFIDNSTTYEVVTLFTSLIFFVDVLVQIGYQGVAYFAYDRYWMIAEVFIVTLSFLVEYIEFVLHYTLPESDLSRDVRFLRAVRFFRVPILVKTRYRSFQASLRRLVSADRRRYQDRGFDLDLTYVYSNVIAMSWPSDSVESLYRNHIDQVARFLDETHPEAYLVFNLCSERQYDETKFHNRCRRYRLDDHNPAELSVMLQFAKEVDTFLSQNTLRNCVAIHCKGGKGRTGTMTCAYLLYAGLNKTADGALQHFGAIRTSDEAKTFQGVESPSQDRYVHYFERLLTMPNMTPPRRVVRITSLSLHYLPQMFWDISKLWFAIVLNPCTSRHVAYVSNPTVTFDPGVRAATAANPSSPKFHSRSMSPTSPPPTDDDSSPFSPTGPACLPFGGNFIVTVGTSKDPMTADDFTMKYAADPQALAKNKALRVDIDINTSGIPTIEGDVTIKFFHNVDNPNSLHAPLQMWFNPSFEGNALHLDRNQVDGPHKDGKIKKWSAHFAVDLTLETVEETSS